MSAKVRCACGTFSLISAAISRIRALISSILALASNSCSGVNALPDIAC